jgi:hypothetical protein
MDRYWQAGNHEWGVGKIHLLERSAILDTSKFVRIAVDWLLRSDIGQVIKTIVDDEAYPDYAMPKESTGRKNKARSKRTKKR